MAGLDLTQRDDLPDSAADAQPRRGRRTAPYQEAARIAADPAYGQVVCFCERVTAGEIRDAFASPIPPADLDGLRRRTRVHERPLPGLLLRRPCPRLAGRCRAEPSSAEVAP